MRRLSFIFFSWTLVLNGCSSQDSAFSPAHVLPIGSSLHQAIIRVPTKLKIERTTNMLSVDFDYPNSLEATNITIDPRLAQGVGFDLYIYPEGSPRPSHYDFGGRDGDLDFSWGPRVWHSTDVGFPNPGGAYVVDFEAAVFETKTGNFDTVDMPLALMAANPKFHIIWKEHLKRIVK